MRNIVVNVQNALLSEAIIKSLVTTGAFRPEHISPSSESMVINTCITFGAHILLMEVSPYPNTTFESRMIIAAQMKKQLPNCKIVLLIDETALPNMARDVMLAKQTGRIDGFLYASVTESYLIATLESI